MDSKVAKLSHKVAKLATAQAREREGERGRERETRTHANTGARPNNQTHRRTNTRTRSQEKNNRDINTYYRTRGTRAHNHAHWIGNEGWGSVYLTSIFSHPLHAGSPDWLRKSYMSQHVFWGIIIYFVLFLRMVEQAQCQDIYRDVENVPVQIRNINMCAASTVGDTCQGDSGGPLMVWRNG